MSKYSKLQFGKRLYHLRKDKGISQTELSVTLGVSLNSISKWENGKTFPELKYFCRLCNELHVSPNEFLEVDE